MRVIDPTFSKHSHGFRPGRRAHDAVKAARGYSFARYADDCNVYVGSKKAGERVMALLRRLYAGLRLQINEAKSAVACAFGRKFLGYELWVAKGQGPRAKGQGPRAKGQGPRAKGQGPRGQMCGG